MHIWKAQKREHFHQEKTKRRGKTQKTQTYLNQEGQNESHNQKKGIQVKQGDFPKLQDHPVDKGRHNPNRMQI